MKKNFLTILFVLIGLTTSYAQTINWVSFEKALELQKKNPKKIFMDVYTDWCGPCKMLEAQTFKNPDVVKYINDNYYAVKFNAEGNESITYKGNTYTNPQYVAGKTGRNGVHQLTNALGVNAYPTMIFFDEEGGIIYPLKGFYKPKEIEIFLKVFAKEEYKKLDSQQKWEDYQKKFKGTFAG